MQYVVGQRYVSESEPELGLGALTALEGKRISISFHNGERTYGITLAPIKRVTFAVGDTVSLINETCGTIEARREEEGLYYYTVDGTEVSELFLSQELSFSSPLDRLKQGISDRNKAFEVRRLAHGMWQKINSSTALGYTGGKIELFPHQFSVAQSICNAQQRRFLLADEVGLGKTIEASLALHRLLITGEVSRAIIVVPQALLHQWFIELYRRFSIVSTVVQEDFHNRFMKQGAEVLLQEAVLIISHDELAEKEELTEALLQSEWDMLIVDEAHHLHAEDETFAIIKTMSKSIRDLLLLTASPDVMDEHSFFALLQLIDPVKFGSFEQFLSEREEYTRIALIAERLLGDKELPETERSYMAQRAPKLWEELDKLGNITQKEAWVRMLVDVCGIGRSLFRNSRSVISGFPKRVATMVPLEGEQNEALPSVVSEWMHQFLLKQKNEKILIICKEYSSMRKLERALGRVKSRKIALFHEEMSLLQLDRSAAWFADPEGANLLIATEIGAEGRNFQYAEHLILADLPNEPELLEQRIGRLDRIGRKKPVSVIIPYVIGSEEERLALWYHKGLQAFEQTVPGAHQLGEEYIRQVLSFAGSESEWQKLLLKSNNAALALKKRIDEGRSRLLEVSSCNYQKAESLITDVSAAQDSSFMHSVERLFQHFGIAMEEHGENIYFLDFDMMTDHTFPIPPLREEGMTITFDRETALHREDVTFLSIDHPMVIGALDLLLTSEKGNCSCARFPGAGETGFLVEFLYTMGGHSDKELIGGKHIAQQSIRLLFDDEGDNVSDIFSEEMLQEGLEEFALSALTDTEIDIQSLINKTLAEAEENVLSLQKKVIDEAVESLKNEYKEEAQRVTLLQGLDSVSIEVSRKYEKLIKSISKSEFSLDAVRLIQLEE